MNSKSILGGFYPAKAKIDFIKIQATHEEKWGTNPLLNKAYTRGRLFVNGDIGRVNDIYLTLHDPTPAELKVFLEKSTMMMILEVELSIDWHLKDESNDIGELEVLRRKIVQALYPMKMGEKITRKYYDIENHEYANDPMNSRSENTVIWREPREWVKIRCYIKTNDQKKEIASYSVRLEVNLSQGELVKLGAHRICLLPDLIQSLQKNLSGYFYVAAGIKFSKNRCRSKNPATRAQARHQHEKMRRKVDRIWKNSGAMGAMRGRHTVKPDAVLNRDIGRALSHYKEKLQYCGFVPQICPNLRKELLHEYDIYQGVKRKETGSL